MYSTKSMRAQVERLASIARSERHLTADDQRFLTGLGRALGVNSIFADSGANLLSAEAINRLPNRQDALERFAHSLAALVEAGEYRPATVQLGDMQLPVHNIEVASSLRAQYSADQFGGLLSMMRDNGVFRVSVAPDTGLVRTCDAAENENMSARQWVTDTVRCGDLERDVDPDGWSRALLTLCHFYNQADELEAMACSISDPDWYRQGDVVNGVAHIFIPGTLKRDTSWFNNKRLESHGLALQAMCQLVAEQLTGLPSAQLRRDDIELMLETIANIASYLKSINTNPKTGRFDFNAPSAGAWEEIPFPGGLTWDTEAMRAGFASLRLLLTVAPTVRQRLARSRFGAWLESGAQLDSLITAAQRKVVRRLFAGKQPMESPIRPSDSSLSFISTSDIKLGRSVVEDVSRHFGVFAFLEEKLVRNNGIIRYAPFRLRRAGGKSIVACDSYLTRDYWIAPELRSALQGGGRTARAFDSGDCSSEEDYVLRNAQASADSEAEWFMVSVMAEGYSRQVSKLLDLAQTRALTANERQLLVRGHSKATEMINRSCARITGRKPNGAACLKSNGRECSAFAVPEAYELVSALGSTTATALPGADTPLAWAASSLYAASKQFSTNLARLMKR